MHLVAIYKSHHHIAQALQRSSDHRHSAVASRAEHHRWALNAIFAHHRHHYEVHLGTIAHAGRDSLLHVDRIPCALAVPLHLAVQQLHHRHHALFHCSRFGDIECSQLFFIRATHIHRELLVFLECFFHIAPGGGNRLHQLARECRAWELKFYHSLIIVGRPHKRFVI